MKINLNVDVHHLTRVEGHGNIKVVVEDGKIKEARWDIVETPRFFEAMLKGKHFTSAGLLTARICGICSIGHCLASLRATEHAMDITIPKAATTPRRGTLDSDNAQRRSLATLEGWGFSDRIALFRCDIGGFAKINRNADARPAAQATSVSALINSI